MMRAMAAVLLIVFATVAVTPTPAEAVWNEVAALAALLIGIPGVAYVVKKVREMSAEPKKKADEPSSAAPPALTPERASASPFAETVSLAEIVER